MKKISISVRSWMNKIICSLIGMTGFYASCSKSEESSCEYGTPTASYSFKGIVTDENGLPIENVKVLEALNFIRKDSCLTDKDGKFSIQSGETASSKILLSFTKEGYNEKDTLFLHSEFEFKKGDGNWYIGNGEKEVNITLYKK